MVSMQLDENLLREQIWRSLRMNLVSNACFMAERLCAQNNHEENKYILAVTYHRQGKPNRAREVLKGYQSEQCRYLLAQCCIELNKLTEAEEELFGYANLRETEGESYESSEYQNRVPNGAAGFYLLGHICHLSGRKTQAIKHLKTALELNPFLWSAYEELSQLGADYEVENIVSQHSTWFMNHDAKENHVEPANLDYLAKKQTLSSEELFITPPMQIGIQKGTTLASSLQGATTTPHVSVQGHTPPFENENLSLNSDVEAMQTSQSSFVTPSPASFLNATPTTSQETRATANEYVTPELIKAPPKLQQAKGRKINYEGKIRKVSGKLFGDPIQLSPPKRDVHVGTSTPVVSTGVHRTKARLQNWVLPQSDKPSSLKGDEYQRNEGPNSHSLRLSGSHMEGDRSEDQSSQKWKLSKSYHSTLQLIGKLALGYAANCKFKNEEAISIFQSLPQNQLSTSWVQCQIAKALFELVKYEESEQYFKEARRLDKQQLQDLEIYSTVLWHLKKETELMYLAHELMSIDRLAPQSWCVLGNCFSLQKEHDTALQFFQRALQLDPNFTYAHTLCGHEYFANEAFENSLRCYRNAIRIDEQHYNAWYGIGQIYYKQEKYEMTEYHFRKALSINQNSSVLRCCLGRTLHKMGCKSEALQLLDEAVTKDPKNAIAKYERAVVLFSVGHLVEALHELESLKDIAPREPNLFFLLGKACKRLGRIDQAMAHFCVALDLEPSSADVGSIKSAIEKLKLPEDSEDSL